MKLNLKISVVIPCFKVKDHILAVLSRIGQDVMVIYIVDDKCPEKTGDYVQYNCKDKRIKIIRHEINQGVGGSVISGYKEAVKDGMDIVVKVDGDGQMDPSLIHSFIYPIVNGMADYTKGNRFFNLEEILIMPKKRIFGNAILSFMSKISSGYWNIFDPTNGFTAIHIEIIKMLPLNKISKRYFFESDMLFRLNTIKAVVVDIPMHAKYDNEISNLRVRNVLFEFITKNISNFFKRIIYNYYLRDFSLASIELPVGFLLFLFGIIYGGWRWYLSISNDILASPGVVMISALPILVGLQFILAFFAYDISSVPRTLIHKAFIFDSNYKKR